jgi:hypothetical protein
MGSIAFVGILGVFPREFSAVQSEPGDALANWDDYLLPVF